MHRRFEKPSTVNGVSDETTSEPISDESDEREEQENGIHPSQQNGRRTNGNEGLAIDETGYCALCGKTSVCKCERCGDFYCSPQCQRKDWPNHRFICFPMPRLIKPGQVSNTKDNLPILKADVKSIEMTKEESRQAYKARQLSFIPIVTDLPPDGATVVLTGFKSANRCYVRSADPTITEEYHKILKKLDNFGKHSNDVTGVPKANTYAIAQREDKWCRVQILSARPDNRIRIHFIDYGTVSVRYLRELRRISGAMSSLPCYVNMIQLHDVTVYSMQTKLLEQISLNVGKEFKMRKMVDSDALGGNIQLYHMDTHKLLNTEILTMCQEFSEKEAEHTSTTSNDNDVEDNDVERTHEKGNHMQSPPQVKTQKVTEQKVNGTPGKNMDSENTTPGKNSSQASPGDSGKKKNLPPAPRQIPKPCLVPPFETIPFDSNAKDVNVVVVDNSYVGRGYLGCLLEKDCDKLQAVQKFLQNYNGTGQAYKPKLEEYCIAEYEGEWYRGKVVEILDQDKFLVAYIDFTNECELTSASIRRYPMSLNLPCSTNLCAIEGLPEELSDKLIEFLEKELRGFTKIHVDSIKMFDDVMFIECKELLKKLHDAKLI